MHGNITGIDISTEHITAVRTASGLKGRRILACTRVPVADGSLEDALRSLAGSMDLRNDTCLVTVPEAHVSFRNVPMPFKDARKIRQALPFEMENMLPSPVEDLLIDFIATDHHAESGVLAALVRKEFISDYLEALQSMGIDPEVLEVRGTSLASWILNQAGTPENILVLEIGAKRYSLILCLNGRISLIRSFISVSVPSPENMDSFFRSLCIAVQNTVHAFTSRTGMPDRPEKIYFTGEGAQDPISGDLLSRFLDIPAEPIDVSQDKKIRMEENIARNWSPALMNGALSLALRNAGKEGGFNLRRDEFGTEGRYQSIRKAIPKFALFLFLILSFLVADMVIDYHLLKKEYRTLDQEITTIFRQTLPQVTRIVDPVQQLRVSVEQMKRSSASGPAAGPVDTVLELLREISNRIPPSISVEVHRMVVDPETIRISGRTDAFNEVDRIKNDLATAKRFGPVNITSANLDHSGNKIQFEITIDRKP
ncbi:MAG: pilus assembly protein PilM [Deltaproteobacteria bacterium]|nr:pilus assembly protein PilM [Deltaproteobacteria bacterium]